MSTVDRTMRVWVGQEGNRVLARQDRNLWALFDPKTGERTGTLDESRFASSYSQQNVFLDPDQRRGDWTIALETPDLMVISDRRPIHGTTDAPHLLVIAKSAVGHLDNWSAAPLSVRRQLDLVMVAFRSYCETRGLAPIAFGNDSPTNPNLKNPRQEVQNAHAHLAAVPLRPAPGEGGFKALSYEPIPTTSTTANWTMMEDEARAANSRTPYCWFQWGDGPIGLIDPVGAGADEYHRQIAEAWGLQLFEDPTLATGDPTRPVALNLHRPDTTITPELVAGFGEFVRRRPSLAAALAEPNSSFANQLLRSDLQKGKGFQGL